MRSRLLGIALVVLALFVVPGLPATAASESLFGSAVPSVKADPDSDAVTVGLQFTAKKAGQVSGIRFYKGSGNTGTHTAALYNASGSRLASGRVTGETSSGWQTLSFAPVSVAAGQSLTAAVFDPKGHYPVQQPYAWPKAGSNLTGIAGVYRYGSSLKFPSSTYNRSNYFVDVNFSVTSTSSPTPSASPTPTAPPTSSIPSMTPTPTAPPSSSTPSVTPTPTAPPTSPTALSLTAVDGGTGYYGRWASNTLPVDSNYFPIGVWMEQGSNATRLAGYGINMIVNPVGSRSTNAAVRNVGALDDEVDMWGGPGDATWTRKYPGQGEICSPASAQCGYTIMKAHQAGVSATEMRYANYGKGISFWESDTQAARFVNDFQDVTSADLYWATDADLCQASQGGVILKTGATVAAAECRKPANYGRTVDRVRSLSAQHVPVWNYVELGHPGTNGGTMPVASIKAAVWSSLLHEARGVVYFNHSFGGTCQSQHVLDECDPAIASTVTAIDAQIAALAPVLNAPKVNGVVKTGNIDQLTKWDGKNVYVFTGSTMGSGSTAGSVKVPTVGNTTAEVLGENRTVPVVDGKISDTWADQNTVHLYRIGQLG